MSKSCSDDKKLKVKQTLKETSDRRKSQICKVYEIKLDKSHLSKEKKTYLNKLFLEAKWLYNHILNTDDIFSFDTKVKEVQAYNKEREIVTHELVTLSSQMKQEIHDRLKGSISSLSTKKKKGRVKEVGRLKFKSQINSIPLKQFGNTYKIENNKYIKLQGFKKSFKVIGLSQIKEDYEIANANLIRKYGNYYLKITCFMKKPTRKETGKAIGLDFGIKDNIIDSEGNKYNFRFPETKRVKKDSKAMNRKVKGSRNRYKQKIRLQKSYDLLSNKKKDAKNKFVSHLKKEYDYICIQDEQINNWKKSKMKGFGRRVQHSIMGGIISELKKHPETSMIDRFYPSTRLCPICSTLNSSSLDIRIYKCNCGYIKDRDIHSANNILIEGLKQFGMERTNQMLAEKMSDLNNFDLSKEFKQFSLKQEAQSFNFG